MDSISDLPPEDARLFTHMGHFLFWYSAVELAITDLIAKAIGFEDRDKLELLVSGMDARRKCQCLRGASGYMEIGPKLKSRLKYFEDSIIKLRNKFVHRVAILPAGSSTLMFGTSATISKIHTSRETSAKDSISVEDLFGKARWLNWFAADLAKALGESALTGRLEIVDPRTSLPPEPHQQTHREAQNHNQRQKPIRNGQETF
jgi:hypothetical protein